MRNTFFDLLFEKMASDGDIFVLAADMGLGLLERFRDTFPDRFLNVGIAEQNLIGVASGLCNAGYKPFCYTISNFLVHRAFEQIRNDVCLHGMPVTLVGTSTGYDNGLLGPTHQVIDDIGCLKALPGISIYCPATKASAKLVFEDVLNGGGPAYVRLPKDACDPGLEGTGLFWFARPSAPGGTALVTYGSTLIQCLQAADAKGGVPVLCLSKVHPLDPAAVAEALAPFDKALVVEDHMGASGLYNSLCQLLMEIGRHDLAIASLSPRFEYVFEAGDAKSFAARYGYDAAGIAAALGA